MIPNWNGRDLLGKYIPSIIEALAGNPDNEIIVVDNGSEDGSAEFLREHFPSVRVLALDRNLGFGGGSNAGFRAAKNDIVVLLNSDMRVEPDFLAPLLEAFTDEKVFSVSCQIFFSDPNKAARRDRPDARLVGERSAARAASRRSGDPSSLSVLLRRRRFLRVRSAQSFWSWADSTSCSRRSIWKTPISATWRGSAAGRCCINRAAWCITSIAEPSARRFSASADRSGAEEELHSVLLEEHSRMAALVVALLLHFCRRGAEVLLRRFAGARQLCGIVAGVPAVARSARCSYASTWTRRHHDTEAFRRPLGGYFRDRFAALRSRTRRTLSVLFVSPYPICPPIHGGGVFMYQTALELTRALLAALGDPARSRLGAAGPRGAGAGRWRRPSIWCGLEGKPEAVRIHSSLRGARVCECRISNGCCIAQMYMRDDRRGAARIHGARPVSAAITGASRACCSSTTSTFNPSRAGSRESAEPDAKKQRQLSNICGRCATS